MIEMVQDVLPMTMLDECREIKLADKSHWPMDGVNVSVVAVCWMGIDITHSGCKAGTSTWCGRELLHLYCREDDRESPASGRSLAMKLTPIVVE